MVVEHFQDAEELEAKVEELESELAKIAENYEAKRKEVNDAIKEAKKALKTAEEIAHAKKVAELSALPVPSASASAPPPLAPTALPKTEAFDDFVESLTKEQVKLLRSVGAITQDLSAVGVPHLFTEDELGNFSIKEQKALFKHGFAARPFTATG
jgi:DNA repair exonuclease SbcCD ATPase subunit